MRTEAAMQDIVQAALEALAVGDAMGMPTEFMTRAEIATTFGGLVKGLIDARQSKLHKDLPTGSITDDTEQNLMLYAAYREKGAITPELTAQVLLRWVEETDAIAKKYIGPSALAAIEALRRGVSSLESGRAGTTCGGIMRTPCVVLIDPMQTEDVLAQNTYFCLVPTHNTWQALEAAGAYAFALQSALQGQGIEGILAQAKRGAALVSAMAPYTASAPSAAARIEEVAGRTATLREDALLAWLHDVLGTGLPSADVCAAVFAIFLRARENVLYGLELAASVGGDTDTIGALVGPLCAAFAGGHNIPGDIVRFVFQVNHLKARFPFLDTGEV